MAKKYAEIEKMISEAANENRPPFNDAAWEKMEALLDKDEKRRPIGLWWKTVIIFLLISAIAFLGYNTYKRQTNSEAVDRSNISKINANPENETSVKDFPLPTRESNSGKELQSGNKGPTDIKSSGQNLSTTSIIKRSGPTASKPTINNTNKPGRKSGIDPTNGNIFSRDPLRLISRNKGGNKITNQIESSASTIPFSELAIAKPGDMNSKPDRENSPGLSRNFQTFPLQLTTSFNARKDLLNKPLQQMAVEMKPIRNRGKFKSTNIYFSALAGLGADGVRYSFDGSRLRSKIGLGFGYGIGPKWNVGLGIRVHDKLYTAGPQDYKVSSGYWSTVQIDYIEADCKVYEIPLYGSYNFYQKNNTTLFATAGLVSFIMKSEKYDIHYKSNNEPHEGYTNAKGNSHLFSSLLLSAGTAKKINKKLQVTAAPALAIPLSGVGKGKVKLNTAELTIGLQYFPWKK